VTLTLETTPGTVIIKEKILKYYIYSASTHTSVTDACMYALRCTLECHVAQNANILTGRKKLWFLCSDICHPNQTKFAAAR